jgi:hypothetical protein
MSSFIESFESLEVIKQFSNFRFMTKVILKMPLFIQNREIVNVGFGIANQEQKSVLMPFRSITDPKYMDIDVPREDTSKATRIIMNFGFYKLTLIDENTTEFVLSFNVDPNVALIPWFVINTFVKEISYYIVLSFKDRIENMDKTVYNKRMEEKKDFYNKIKREVIDTLK